MKSKAEVIIAEKIEQRILLVRGKKIILDRDLAFLYEVETKALNQAVKRNPARFPADFQFQLSRRELNEVVTNCDHLQDLKFSHTLPYAFTEHGVLMLSSVLNGERAIAINIPIMRVFTKLREPPTQMIYCPLFLKLPAEQQQKRLTNHPELQSTSILHRF